MRSARRGWGGRRSLPGTVGTLILGVAAVLQGRFLAADDYAWNSPFGGNFGEPSYWSPPGPPGPSDRALFTLPRPAYTVMLDNDYTNDRLLVDGGDVNLHLEGRTYTLTHDFLGVGDTNHAVEIGSNPGQITSGKLTVTGGTVAALHTLLGRNDTNTGELVVSNGGYWDSSDYFDTIGVDGTGRLTIEQGGRFDSFYMFVAFNNQARGSILVTGRGSLLDNAWFAILGRYGETQGELTIQSSGEARIGQLMLGETSAASGTLRVNGSGSICSLVFTPNSEQSLIVGEGGTGMATVENAGRLVCSQNGVIGNLVGSAGTIVVRGAGSRMDVSKGLRVGRDGHGSLEVLDGALVTVAEYANVAGYGDSRGHVLVEGAGSRLALSQGLSLGGEVDSGGFSNASASLTIQEGGYVSVAGDINYGLNSTSHVTGLVTGAGSTLSIGNALIMGQFNGPTTTLTVSQGGLATMQTVLAAHDVTSQATILVTDSGSRLAVRDLAILGGVDASTPGGSATVCLADQGSMEVAGATVVFETSRLTLDGGTFTGQAGIQNHGLISGRGLVAATLENVPEGEVRGDPAGTLTFSGSANANAGTIALEGGTIEFTGTLVNDVDGVLTGRGTLRTGGLVNGGSMAFSAGLSDIHGDVENESDGRIITSGGGTTTFWDDVVHNGAEIRTSAGCATVFFGSVSGSGPFTPAIGAGTVYFEGDLKPGNSPAAVSFGGNVVFGSGASLEIELGGRLGGSQYDTLAVAGTASLDGELSVRLLGTFQPKAGDTFTVMTFADHVGEFASYDGFFQGEAPLVPVYRTSELVLVATYPGDANVDGNVTELDATILAAHWLMPSGATWGDGDFTGDGKVTDLDASILAANWLSSAGSAAVPEPATVVLLGSTLGVALTLGWRRVRSPWRMAVAVPC